MPFKEFVGKVAESSKSPNEMTALMDRLWKSGIWKNPTILNDSEHLRFLNAVLPGMPAKLLEAGCGLGKWVRFYHDKGYHIYGVDFSRTALKEGINVWPDLRFACSNLKKLPFENDTFDGIISFGAIEHDIDGPEAALKELFRVLVNNGVMYCTVPCFNTVRKAGLMPVFEKIKANKLIRKKFGKSPEMVFFEYVFTVKEYEKILTDAGFDVIKIIPLEISKRLMGKTGSVYYRFAKYLREKMLIRIHRKYPWLMAHMMAAICKKSST